MNNICVFCGSSKGNNPEFEQAAVELGRLMAKQNQRLIYGGGNVGLMGIVADQVMKNGGQVTGIIPEFLIQREAGHRDITELIVVDSMHERKQKMAELADAFIALPGGYGTLEELAEIVTWIQLDLVQKPIGVLNVAGYYDPLLSQFDIMAKRGFISVENRHIMKSSAVPAELIDLLVREVTEAKVNGLNKT